MNIDKKIGAQWVQALLSAPKISAENRDGDFMARAACCPFFGEAKGRYLRCYLNGETPVDGELNMSFPSITCRKRYWVDFCCNIWEDCPLSDALNRKTENIRAGVPCGLECHTGCDKGRIQQKECR